MYTDNQKPGGCINVEDTNLGQFVGIKQVKVILKHGWLNLKRDVVYTDDNGCFKLNKRITGDITVKVEFKHHSRHKVRGVQNGINLLWQWLVAMEDKPVSNEDGVKNNFLIEYPVWTEEGSEEHRFWGGATIYNAVNEYHEYANNEGFLTPPEKLDIYAARNRNDGYCLMGGGQVYLTTLAAGTLAQLGIWFPALAPFTSAAAIIGWPATILYLADVMVGTNTDLSNRIKETVYHELGHASHYRQIGIGYWKNVINAEILAGGWGDADGPNADLIALVESWAEFISLYFANETYSDGTDFIPNNDYSNFLETYRNVMLNHIPVGFYYDLIDDTPDTAAACDLWTADCGPINDAVFGITVSEMFDALTSNVDSPADFRNAIRNGRSSATVNAINTLFNDY